MKRPYAFTLIELLVVISIISLLVAILLPALSGARKAAEQAGCMSGVKQLATAMEMYLNDYDEFYPPRLWNHVTGVVIPQPPTHPHAGKFWYRLLEEQYVPGMDSFRCPSHVEFTTSLISYGYNYLGSSDLVRSGDYGGPGMRINMVSGVVTQLCRRTDIEAPQTFLILGDSTLKEIMFHPAIANNEFGVRHDLGGNIAWGDAHVSYERKEDVDGNAAWWTRWND